MAFQEISIQELKINPVSLFADGWALLTAGDRHGFNSMTISWGAIGEIWNKPAVFAFVRPQRYTDEFMEKSEFFTVSCFGGSHRRELGIFGTKSGRDSNKYEETGLTSVQDGDTIYCGEAELIFICKKAAKTVLQPENFYDETIAGCYEAKDYHKIYVGEIIKVLVNK